MREIKEVSRSNFMSIGRKILTVWELLFSRNYIVQTDELFLSRVKTGQKGSEFEKAFYKNVTKFQKVRKELIEKIKVNIYE